jgi:hypothetical protein
MTVAADILSLAPAIAAGAAEPPPEPERRRDIGRLIDAEASAALTCIDAVLSARCVAP